NHQALHKTGAIDHIAIDTTDIDAAFAEVTKSGLTVVSAIQSLPFWDKGIKFFKIEGPNKELIEFCQIL
ncbi:MAG: VOC family protein, partial [Treponema sp.]|nr:VOC family protein [Treponema sp.]